MQAILALEDGRIFRGQGYGHPGECQGEVVFNTSLTGYQEIATDPSYAGQIVVLTNPQIGNYGTNHADNEAAKPYIEGLIVREFSTISSNWRSEQVTDEYMERYSVPVLAEIDTRALVRHLRNHGVMRGVISTTSLDAELWSQRPEKFARWTGPIWRAWFRRRQRTVSMRPIRATRRADPLLPKAFVQGAEEPEALHVVAYDFGIKQNILRMLTREGCRVTVVPAETTADDVLALKPDGVFLSNGPGDPEPVDYAVKVDSRHDGARAGVWNLPGAPTLRAGARRQDLQAQVRASWRQPPGAQQRDGQGGDYGAQP